MIKFIPSFILFLSLFYINSTSAYAYDFESMQAPQIRLIKLISFSAQTQTAIFEVSVYNPNDHKIPVRELSGEISINQQLVSKLEASSRKSLAALSTQNFTVPVTLEVDAAKEAANRAMLSGNANYEFRGYMMTPVGELPITKSGRLSAEQILIFLRAILFSQNIN